MSNTTDDNTPTEEPEKKVLNFADFKKAKDAVKAKATTTPGPATGQKKARRYFIDLKADTVEIEGFLGLSGAFLAVGDEDGNIKFGVAQGEWVAVYDVTDTDTKLEDYVDDKKN